MLGYHGYLIFCSFPQLVGCIEKCAKYTHMLYTLLQINNPPVGAYLAGILNVLTKSSLQNSAIRFQSCYV